MWATNTGINTGAASVLTLAGSAADNSLTLQVYDYSRGRVSKSLYPASNSQGEEKPMPKPVRQLKYSGMVAPHDTLHRLVRPTAVAAAPDEQYIAPTLIPVNIVWPTPETIQVQQYAPTVVGGSAAGYDPSGDCGGNFMSYKFQPNNNCYAYGCNITTNTFPQPGRKSGYLLTSAELQGTVSQVGERVAAYAVKDGLQPVGTTLKDILSFKSARQGTTPPKGELGTGALNGHFVALMISPAGTDGNWGGDYHWARCDNSSGACDSWSQKDGGDQVTNFDFAGKLIVDPSLANWTVNQGPISQGGDALVVDYQFYCFMFVPASGVNII
jgi:hypothetical protein